MYRNLLSTLAGLAVAGSAFADYKVDMTQIDMKGVGASVGTVSITAGPSQHLAMKDLGKRALVIHEGGDNFSDQPKPDGGGGTRIACGVIGEK